MRPNPQELEAISKVVILLRELFKTNKIEPQIAGAAMDTYIWMMMEDSFKIGIIDKKQLAFIVTSSYQTKMQFISLLKKETK